MSESADATGGDATVTFKVKTSSDGNHTITMSESATVLDLKTKLAGEDYENIPVERQRLIYSGRVMKNDDNLATYKIKPNNTIHMVKSAASNPGQPASSSAQAAPQAVPTNMASGTANNPLAGLTGARYAGQGLNMPGLDMFGPDGGMGPPMDEAALARMMADPNAQQALNEVLDNPDVVNHLIESNPMLRNVPNAREIIQSPFMRQMMTNPQMMTQMMRMRRSMGGGGAGAFPAPGATDNAPTGDGAGATGGDNANPNMAQNPFMNPFMFGPGMGGGFGGGEGGQGGGPDGLMNMLQQMQAAQTQAPGAQRQGAAGTGDSAAGTESAANAGAGTGTTGAGTTGQGDSQNQAPANPFAALFGAPGGGGGAGAGAGAGGAAGNPFGMTPEMMQSMMQMLGGAGGGAPAGPPDNRPPEERYAEQLRQLNDMGFFDFDRNVAALRRSGGSVQGAIEHLLNATD